MRTFSATAILKDLLVLGLLVVASSAWGQSGDAALRQAGESGSHDSPPLEMLPRWAVPESYEVALRSDPNNPGYTGTVTIGVQLKKPSSYLWLHGKNLDVSQVSIVDARGQRHAGRYVPVDPDAGVARVEFGGQLQPQQLTLTMVFSAPYDKTLEGYYKVVFAGDSYAMTQMEPISARLAFPCFDEPGFKAPLSLSLTVPQDDVAVANTAQISSVPADQGWKTVTFAKTPPLPTYLYAWAVGPWDVVAGPVIPANKWRSEPLPVRGIATRGNGAKMERVLAMVPAIIGHEEAYYGFRYPFGKIDLAALPDFSAGAMENPGLVTFRDWLMLLDADSSPSAVRSSFNVIAHELAHQWTGDLVTMKWWNDIWLNEAFATWMQQKVQQDVHPDWHNGLARLQGGQGAMRNDSLVSARMIRQPITGNGDIHTAFDGITYQKGAAVIGMFENFVGEEVFQKGMRNYIRAHQFGNADAGDLVSAISGAANKGPKFRKAFKSFLDQNGVPLVATKLDCDTKGEAKLELSQSRYLPLGSTGDTMRLWGIPVCARFPDGVQCHLLNTEKAIMPIKGGQCPAWYMPNANGEGYYRFQMAEDESEALTRVISGRNDAEQLAYADSVSAAFRRGDLDAGQVLSAMRQLAPSKVRQIATALIGTVGWIYDHEARTDAQKDTIRDAIEAAYLSRLQALGYHRRAGEPAEDALMRTTLAGVLALEFKVPTVLAALAEQGEKALKLNADGLPDLDAADPDLLRSALSVAVEKQGETAVETLVAAIPKTTDPVKRNAMLSALGNAKGSAATVARNFALSSAVKVGEMNMVLRGAGDTQAERDEWWTWFTDHYDRIAARTNPFAAGGLPGLGAGAACSTAEAQRLGAFFEPKVPDLQALGRGLAQTQEAINLCAALKARQDPAAIGR